MTLRFHGQEREKILDRLVNKWLPSGPPVAILQGFPGCGKSQLARVVAGSTPRSLDPVEPQIDSTNPVVDLYLELAINLEAHGLPDLVHEIDKGNKANLNRALLEVLRHKQILIVIDEFQRLLPQDKSTPPSTLAKLVEDLNNSPHSQGRLLLISNRFIKTERWSENCQVEEVKGLPDEEAQAFFTELLETQSLEAAVPPERRREIVHRLGGNPRALKTLVVGLRTERLDDLLSTAPDLWKPGDVVLNPGLVEDFEREVLERALPRLETDLLKFMRWLSVHRRPFKKEALAQFIGGHTTPEALRKQLFDRFLLERTAGGDVPHPLAREISVTRLRTEGREWKQANNLAANYYFRYFKARQLTDPSNLAASYIELRHHLYEAGRISELYQATENLTRYAISQIRLDTPVPTHKEALEERIAMLSALPDPQRPRVLEYHLARCFLKRGAVGDKERALFHARRGTGRSSIASPWLLLLDLEYELNGIDVAQRVVRDALGHVRIDQDARAIYQRGAELLARANRVEDGIALLEKGLAVQGLANPAPLYQTCAELLARANRVEDGIALLEKGLAVVPAHMSLYIYQAAVNLAFIAQDFSKAEAFVVAGLTAIPKRNNRTRLVIQALRLFSSQRDSGALKRILAITGTAQLEPRERALAECHLLRISNNWVEVVEFVRKKRAEFPFYSALRMFEADALIALGQIKEADDLLRDYRVNDNQLRDNPVVWLKAYLSLFSGRLGEAKTLTKMYAPNDVDAVRPLDEAEMIRLWSIARERLNGPLEEGFPGLSEYRRQIAAQSQAALSTSAVQTSEQIRLLVVATEWDSRHGGLSSFNRELCAGLAVAGARVVCYVPEASASERQRASEVNVEIIEATKTPGFKDTTLLVNPPELPAGFVPDVVIGHDRITGAASVALTRYHYRGSKRVLFIHTSPEEIEWHKEHREDSTSAARAAERKREQLGLAEGCDLVVAVGPRLTSEFGTDLQGTGNQVPIMELTPGLPECPSNVVAALPLSIRCLILGRVEDYQLKGLDLAAKALGRVVANWRQDNPPKLIVRGAPVGTDAALRSRLTEDSAPTELDIVIRHYSADETEIRNDLREASLVLMPSKKEGFGLVGLEAIACGVPTLISTQSGLAGTVKRHAPELANEWILPVTGDAVTEWSGRIKFLLEAREGAFARAIALRERLTTELDWKRAAAELLGRLVLVRAT